MHFEPYKKTYYRFPSTKSVAKIDKQMYFPEKPNHATDNPNYDHPTNSYVPEREHNYDFK
ncbi:MAG: hypothetical protein PHC56_09415 [Herbinix sp.]|nr:hypothetical protein [Herbinix sp.]